MNFVVIFIFSLLAIHSLFVSFSRLFVSLNYSNNLNTTSPSEFNSVLRPFKARSFATGIPSSHGGIAPMAIAELADETFLISGGQNRGSLYKVDQVGGEVGTPITAILLNQ